MELRVLFVEDSADDAELMLRRLRDAGFEPRWDRVETEAALRQALAAERWDLALVDYHLPGFGGIQALNVLAEAAPGVPAITVSGAIDEDTAVATIKAGAVDYVLKDNLTRLTPAVQRAIQGAELWREQRRATEAARLAQFAVEHAPVSMLTIALDGTVLYANEAQGALRGVPTRDLVGQKMWETNAAMTEEAWGLMRDAAVRDGRWEHEVELLRDDGERRLVDAVLQPIEYEGTRVLVGWGRDITGRARAESALRESEEHFRAFFEQAAVGMATTSLEKRWLEVNDTLCDMLGYSHEDFDGVTWADLTYADDLAADVEQFERLTAGEIDSYVLEKRMVHKSGRLVSVRVARRAVRDAAGDFQYIAAILADITERKRAENALRESEERFEAFAAHLPGYLFMHDEKLRYVYVNRRTANDADLPRQDWFGKTPSQLWEGESGREEDARVQRALDGEVIDSVVRWTPGGLREYLHSIYFPIAREGKQLLVGGLSIDVTAQVEAQDEVLRQAEQLKRTVEGAVLAMSHVVETRDPYTAGHERRVAELATALAVEMDMEPEAVETLRLAALIHDIGKIAVPAEILAKPGRLSEVEFNLIKQHPQSGFEILAAIDFGRPVAELVLQHHERLDGSGYPRALAGAAILPEACVLAVADVVEAMSSHRPYRAALGMEAALAEVREHAGVKYDAAVVAACVRLFEEQGFALTV